MCRLQYLLAHTQGCLSCKLELGVRRKGAWSSRSQSLQILTVPAVANVYLSRQIQYKLFKLVSLIWTYVALLLYSAPGLPWLGWAAVRCPLPKGTFLILSATSELPCHQDRPWPLRMSLLVVGWRRLWTVISVTRLQGFWKLDPYGRVIFVALLCLLECILQIIDNKYLLSKYKNVSKKYQFCLIIEYNRYMIIALVRAVWLQQIHSN